VAESISFARSLYLPEAVQAAAAAYADLARIDVSDTGNDLIVTISDPDPSVAPEIGGAFANHALHETILRRGAAVGR
jgi:hypothetical protein